MPSQDDGAERPWSSVAERIREVAEACREASLARLRVVDGDLEIEVRLSAVPHCAPAGDAAPAAGPGEYESLPSTNGAVATAPEPAYVRSDVVGIVRLSRPAVSAGETLPGERELAYIESLGVRNPVSGGPGRIAGVLVEDGQAVEYGQRLFAIER